MTKRVKRNSSAYKWQGFLQRKKNNNKMIEKKDQLPIYAYDMNYKWEGEKSELQFLRTWWFRTARFITYIKFQRSRLTRILKIKSATQITLHKLVDLASCASPSPGDGAIARDSQRKLWSSGTLPSELCIIHTNNELEQGPKTEVVFPMYTS